MATSVLAAITYTQQLAQTDSGNIGSVLGLALYNDARTEMHRDMLAMNLDAAGTQEAYRDLSANSPATFLWPDDMYSLKTIEVNFQNNQQQDYIQAKPVEVANIQGRSFDWLRANQPQEQPLFDNRGDWFEIFPTPQTSNAQGVRIFYVLTPTDAPDVGTAITYPYTLDFRALSCKMAALYYKQQNDMNMAAVYEQEYQERIKKIINILAPGTQQPLTPAPLAMNGWNF